MSTITRRTLLSSAAAAAVIRLSSAARFNVASAAIEGSSRLAVDGLDVAQLNEKFLELVRKGGVDCVHKTVSGIAGAGTLDNSFGAVHEFADKHGDRMIIATSVRDIRQARQTRRVAFVLGWQDANILDGPLRESRVFTTMKESWVRIRI